MLRSSNSIPPRMPKEMTIIVERYIRAIKKTVPFQSSFSLLGMLAMSLLFSLFLFLSCARDTQAAPGDLDPSFGTGGKVLTNFSSSTGCSDSPNCSNGANAIAIQSDGKIIAAGFSSPLETGIAVARYNLDGSLDTTFGDNGMVFTKHNPGGIDSANAVTIQRDGKIVVAGFTTVDGSDDFILVRYNTDGSLDTSFGTGGIVTTNFSGPLSNGSDDDAKGVAIQTDGKILAAGFSNGEFALARYNTDGSLDTSFGIGGKVLTDFNGGNDGANAVATQTDGKIILAGFSHAIAPGGSPLAGDFALARYNTDGSLDPSFGNRGKVTTNFIFIGVPSNGGDDAAHGVAIQTDGKIVAAGFFKLPVGGAGLPTGGGFALARYNTDGSLDTSFGSGGKVTTVFTGDGSNDVANGIAIQSDGKIVAAGVSLVNSSDEFALARYDTDGSLDTSFGIEGKVLTDFGNGNNDVAEAVVIQADGKIVAAGSFGSVSSFRGDFALARYLGIGNTPSPNNNSSGCSIVESVETETGEANLLIPLIPALAISLRMLRRRKKDI